MPQQANSRQRWRMLWNETRKKDGCGLVILSVLLLGFFVGVWYCSLSCWCFFNPHVECLFHQIHRESLHMRYITGFWTYQLMKDYFNRHRPHRFKKNISLPSTSIDRSDYINHPGLPSIPWRGEEVAPSWPKAVYRRGVALRGLKRFDMAISAFAQGMEQDAGRKP